MLFVFSCLLGHSGFTTVWSKRFNGFLLIHSDVASSFSNPTWFYTALGWFARCMVILQHFCWVFACVCVCFIGCVFQAVTTRIKVCLPKRYLLRHTEVQPTILLYST